MGLPPEVPDLLKLLDCQLAGFIGGPTGAGNVAVGPGVILPGFAVVLADFDEAAGELVEEVRLLDEVAAGPGQWGKAVHRLLQRTVGGFLLLPRFLLFCYHLLESVYIRSKG